MKYLHLISLAAAVHAVVVPVGQGPEQVVMQGRAPPKNEPWWGEVDDGYAKAVEDFMTNLGSSAEHGLDAAIRGLEYMGRTIGRELGSLLDGHKSEDYGSGNHGGRH